MKAQEILTEVSRQTGVSIEEIKSSKRDHHYVVVRSIVCRKMKEEGYSLKTIGETINRHHASVCHLLKTYKDDGTRKRKSEIVKDDKHSHVAEIVKVFDDEINRLQQAKKTFIQIMNR